MAQWAKHSYSMRLEEARRLPWAFRLVESGVAVRGAVSAVLAGW